MKISLSRQVFLILFIFFISITAYAADEAIKSKLQSMLDPIVSDNSIPGAVLLVSSPKIGTVSVASGYSDKETKTPMRIDNNFRIASMSKTFLSVAILKLVELGKLNLDDKISDLLSDSLEIDRIPNGRQVTVRQLLGMRSGIPNYMEYDAYSKMVENDPDRKWSAEDCIKIIYDAEPSFKADSSYEYSNTNYSVLQYILEKVTGESYEKALRKFIFDPAGMKNTYVEVHEEREGGFKGLHTHGYDMQGKKVIDVTEYNDGFGLGDGGIVSTAEDMMLFVHALLETKSLLSENILHEMLQVKGEDRYGLGIYQEQAGDELAWTHNGSASGFSGQYYYLPKAKMIIILLTNIAGSGIYDSVVSGVLGVAQ